MWKSGIVVGDCVPVGFWQEQGWKMGKGQILGEALHVRSKVGTMVKVISESRSVVSHSCDPRGPYSAWNSPGQNTAVGSLSLLQRIFPTQESNPGLPHCRRIRYQLSHKGSPRILEWVAYPFSSRSSRPKKERGSPVLQVDSLPSELSGKLKVIRESQCQPGPDCREYNAGS